jgi:hypothetical protein
LGRAERIIHTVPKDSNDKGISKNNKVTEGLGKNNPPCTVAPKYCCSSLASSVHPPDGCAGDTMRVFQLGMIRGIAWRVCIEMQLKFTAPPRLQPRFCHDVGINFHTMRLVVVQRPPHPVCGQVVLLRNLRHRSMFGGDHQGLHADAGPAQHGGERPGGAAAKGDFREVRVIQSLQQPADFFRDKPQDELVERNALYFCMPLRDPLELVGQMIV